MDTLSIRAQQAGSNESKLLANFMLVQKNSYDDELNPNGICNCGVAENSLCENELVSKLQTIQIWKPNHMYYPDSSGQMSLRKALCHFFENIFQLNYQLDPTRMMISSGLSGVML
jgi:aspartate/methionine/tyrosine aminotransferase